MDERIGNHFIFPGAGFGGSCFPKDIRALAYLGQKLDRSTQLLQAVEDVNIRQKMRMVDMATGYFKGELSGRTFAVWGLSFKPRTDDVRDAPALVAIRALVAAGASVVASDPIAIENASGELKDLGDSVRYVKNHYDALDQADALMIFTEWNEYRSPNFETIKSALASPVIFDGRNLYNIKKMQEREIDYFCIGRATVHGAW
jgi:UDPglucose 6-dehydrogenase